MIIKMTARLRPLVVPAIVALLLAFAGFGVRQVIQGQEAAPDSLTSEERQQRYATADAASRDEVAAFRDAGGDACALESADLLAENYALYTDIPMMVNNIDLIVVGQLSAEPLQSPGPSSGIAGRVLASVAISDVSKGSHASGPILVDVGAAVMTTGKRLARIAVSGLDPCEGGRVLLFLERTDDPAVFHVAFQNWARLDGSSAVGDPLSEIFDSHQDESSLIAAVQDAVADQQSREVPSGQLLCESRKISTVFADPIVCTGDTFNPYTTFRLEPSKGAHIETTDPGPEPYVLSRSDLEADSPRLQQLLSSLDTEVTLGPASLLPYGPVDKISLTFLTEYATNDRTDFSFWYSPSQGIVQIPVSGAQFEAPEAFKLAMEPFLAAPQPSQDGAE